jgi:hypothetical protein
MIPHACCTFTEHGDDFFGIRYAAEEQQRLDQQ